MIRDKVGIQPGGVMSGIDDITLVAYVDGELDPATCAEVETLLADSEELREKVRGLRESTALVRAAFNHALYGGAMPEFDTGRAGIVPFRETVAESGAGRGDRAISPGATGKPRRWVWRRWPSALPLAASLAALVIGATLGHYFTERSIDSELRNAGFILSSQDQLAIQTALTQGLEKELSGTRVTWANPDTGHGGEIVPIRTFQAENGQYCREFLDVRRITGSTQDHGGIACRSADGVWKVRVRYLPENGGV